MAVVVIHSVRISKGLPLEPVGVWRADGSGEGEAFYPPEYAQYRERGQRALIERPIESVEAWAAYKAHTSPNWRVLETDPSGLLPLVDSIEALESVYLDVRKEHEERVAHKAALIGDAVSHRAVEDAIDDGSVGWGANRFAVAQSWWVAAELVRRHPELLVYEMHPAGGQSDVLKVAVRAQHAAHAVPDGVGVWLNRIGTVQVHSGDRSEVVATWREALDTPNPHSLVKRLEEITQWGSPVTTAETTHRALVYRLFAAALTMLVNDRHAWDVRSEFLDTSEWDPSPQRFVDAFPAAKEAMRSTPRLGIWGEPHSHFWAILCDNQPVAIVSIEGSLYTQAGKTVDLMAVYEQHSRRVLPFTVAVLNKWL